MRWLQSIFRSEDPIIKLVAALSEPEAQMRRELLENNGVPAMVKDRGGGLHAIGGGVPFGYDLFVKKSDAERAAEILGSLMDASPDEKAPTNGSGGDGAGP